MNYILFDDSQRNNLLPFTFLRPIAEIRIGITTIKEKWEHFLNAKVSYLTEDYLSDKYSIIKSKKNILISGSVVPNKQLVDEIKQLKEGELLIKDDFVIAMCFTDEDSDLSVSDGEEIDVKSEFIQIKQTYSIFSNNAECLNTDFQIITTNRKSQPIPNHCIAFSHENIFIEEGAQVLASTLNASEGIIYIGKNAVIMEGSHLRGPVAICENAQVKMGAKIYGGTTIGPYCKVGGEVSNTVFFGYSNKAHDGYIGNSVIAEWCNIGAGTNVSNLKNTYDTVKLWNYTEDTFVDSGLQFCGLIMGDHSKCGINTMFNSGTVLGICTNIFGSNYQRNFIPSFNWGGVKGFVTYKPEKAIAVAEQMYNRRGIQMSETDKKMLYSVYKIVEKNFRRF